LNPHQSIINAIFTAWVSLIYDSKLPTRLDCMPNTPSYSLAIGLCYSFMTV